MQNKNEKTKHETPSAGMLKWEKTEKLSRIIYLNDPIDKDTAFKINRELLMLDELSNNPIKIFINSPGGEINSGFFIFDCIKFVRSPVYTIGAGLIASAAALIYLAVEKEFRFSLPHARYMLHQPMSGSRGVVTDLEIHAKEVDELKLLINKILADATGNSIKKIEVDTDRDYWLNAQDAKKYGVVNTIITNKNELATIFPIPNDEGNKEKSTDVSTQTVANKTAQGVSKNNNSTKTQSKENSNTSKSQVSKSNIKKVTKPKKTPSVTTSKPSSTKKKKP